jgi:hypothetical protein
VNETCSPAEQAAIAAFKNGASVNRVAGLIGRTPGSIEWLLKKNGLKRNDHRKPRADEAGDAIAAAASQSVRKPPPSPDADRATVSRGDEALRRDPASYWRDAALQDAVFEARERLEALSGPGAVPPAAPNPARERVREIEAMLHDSSGLGQRRYWSDPALREDYAKALADVHGGAGMMAAETSFAASDDVVVAGLAD